MTAPLDYGANTAADPASSDASALRVTVLLGSPNEASKTRTLAELALETLAEKYSLEVSRVDVYRLGAGLTSAVAREDVDEQAEAALVSVEQAELLIAAVPVFRGSYPGIFKHFLDLIDQHALVAKPVLLLATGGSDRHALVIDQVLRPLFGFFQAFVAPAGVYASSMSFAGTLILDPGAHTRMRLALDDLDPILPQAGRRIETPAKTA